MQYGKLNLRGLREDCGIDFAHFTYQRGMCSCCYSPTDLPKRYWKNGIVKECGDAGIIDESQTSYILFKNADNGSGTVKRSDEIEDNTYIEWGLTKKQLPLVLAHLRKQLGDKYEVIEPEGSFQCITIKKVNPND